MVTWRKDFDEALKEAKGDSKLVFFDVFNPV